MLSLGPGVQIMLATEPIDLRRGHDGLVTLVRSLWKADPYAGTLFVFFGRRLDRVKILFFSAGGFPEAKEALEIIAMMYRVENEADRREVCGSPEHLTLRRGFTRPLLVALGRKNFLFVQSEDAGKELALLYSLVVSCTRVNVNPVKYIADVLDRIDKTAKQDLRDLLPEVAPSFGPEARVAKVEPAGSFSYVIYI